MSPTALVTGVGRREGIGAAICTELATTGHNIAYSFWSPYDRAAPLGSEKNFGASFEDELRRLDVQAHGIEADLSSETEPAELMRKVRALLGDVTVLVNNAAVSEQGDIRQFDAGMMDRHYAVNVRGMVLLTQAYVDQYSGAFPGRVVNLTSGQSKGPMPDEVAYATSKGAVEAFTLTVYPTLARDGITINAINPGPTDSGWISEELRAELITQFPFGRIGTPQDVAKLVGFLVSDEGGWVTGQIIHSEGGFWRK
ncbi:SDR family oxidoreductase [soil metagenome]